jgi:HD-GYP domain-containing protein (c-di-GMP phosphodiesterase class II)
MDKNRLKHSISVARKMVEIATKMNLTKNEKKKIF